MDILNPSQTVKLEMKIDFQLLRYQKHQLLKLANQHEWLDGIIHLVDDIQDSFYNEIEETQGKETADNFAKNFIYKFSEE